MKFEVESVPRHREKSLLSDKIPVFINKNAVPPVIKRKKQAPAVNWLIPYKILNTHWSKWNEPDVVKYEAVNGESYIIYDENLLSDICKFMDINGFRGLHPYIHIEGEYEWDCYPAPSAEHLIGYLSAYNYNYDIYNCGGDLIREANNEKGKFNLNVQFQ